MYIVIALFIGVIVGMIIYSVVAKQKSIGCLVIDRSDPDDEPYLFLELEKSIYQFQDKKYITMKLTNKNYISQK